MNNQLNQTGVDLLLTDVLRPNYGANVGPVVERLYSQNKGRLAWNLGDRVRGHLANLTDSVNIKMAQLLLFTLPGTPIFNYGDEIGLKDEVRIPDVYNFTFL